jgi:hypothetical protein
MSAESPQMPFPREKERPREIDREIDSVITAKGSVYRYLPDGTTQRYKTAEQKDYEPQTAIVFVPDYETIKKSAPSSFNVYAVLGENETQFEQSILEKVQGNGSRSYIVNAQGTKLNTNEAIEQETGPIFLRFGSDNKVDFFLPVSPKPKVGYYPFDTRKYHDPQDRQWKRERHLGNKVTEIRYK